MADDHDTDDDDELDDEPEVAAHVRDAAEQLLAHARASRRRSMPARRSATPPTTAGRIGCA
ncbi:MAG: hypothetical protein LC777_07925 [Actinobacteria bacterium]|nr:hypothetical protein [Actinomycetota bacterium]